MKKLLKSKKVVCILTIMLVAGIGTASCLTIKANADKVLVRDQVVLESGTSTNNLEKRFIEKRGNLEISRVEYTNTDKEVTKRKELATVDVYLNSKGEKVDRDEACDKKGTEEKPAYVLKKGYTKDVRLIDVYSYDVKIIAKDGRIFKSKLVLKDTKAPKLIAKETVEVTEGDEIKADLFFERYEDASNRAHGDMYFVKEVKVEDSKTTKEDTSKDTKKENTKKKAEVKKTTSLDKKTESKTTKKETKEEKPEVKYEKYELTDEDKKVGEHELLVVIEDPSKHVSEPVKVKLVVKEKPVEEEPEEVATGGNTGYSGGSRSGGTYRRSSGGYSGGNSGGSVGGSACGSQGYARMMPKSGMMISQSMLFAFWGCNGSDANWVSKTNQANQELAFGAGVAQLNACNARYGGSCYDYSIPETVYDVATGKSVGMYAPFVMESSAGIVGRGYMLPGSVVMTFRNY